jgi:tetratricopeptide (TPR) repeat protein
MIKYDWKAAETALRRAHELAPTHERVRHQLAFCLSLQGKPEGAKLHLASFAANPLSTDALQGRSNAHYYSREFAEVIRYAPTVFDRLDEGQQNMVTQYVALSHAALAEFDKAVEVADRLNTKTDPYNKVALAEVYALAGKRDRALALRDEIPRDWDKSDTAGSTVLAIMEDALGNTDAALDYIENDVASHNVHALFLKIERFSPALRSQPRFVAALRTVGLADGIAAGPARHVAVLPVEGAGELLADGLRVALTVDLHDALATSGVPLLALDEGELFERIGGTAALLGRERDPIAAARAIAGVTTVVRTALAKPSGGDQLALDVMIDRTGAAPWTKRFARPVAQATQLVEDVARAVAVELGHQAPRTRRDVAEYAPTIYREYGSALAAMFQAQPPRARFEKARAPLEALVANTPGLTRAAARLALRIVDNAQQREDGTGIPMIARAKAIADRALAADPDDPLALAARASAAMIDYDWPAADAASRRALVLAPTHARIRFLRAFYAMLTGTFDESLDLARSLRAAHPLAKDPATGEAWFLYYARRYRELVELARPVVDRRGADAPSLLVILLALSYAELARFDEAVQTIERVGDREDVARGNFVVVYALAGKYDKASALRTQIGDGGGLMMSAQMDDALGKPEAALARLEKIVERHTIAAMFLKIERFTPQLRAHPGFQALMKKTGFAKP